MPGKYGKNRAVLIKTIAPLKLGVWIDQELIIDLTSIPGIDHVEHIPHFRSYVEVYIDPRYDIDIVSYNIEDLGGQK